MIAAMLVLALAIPATTPSTADPIRVVAATTVGDGKLKEQLIADYKQWRVDHDGIGLIATARLNRSIIVTKIDSASDAILKDLK